MDLEVLIYNDLPALRVGCVQMDIIHKMQAVLCIGVQMKGVWKIEQKKQPVNKRPKYRAGDR